MKTSILFVILNILCLYSSAFSAQNLVEIKQTDASIAIAVDGDDYSCYWSKKSKHNHLAFRFYSNAVGAQNLVAIKQTCATNSIGLSSSRAVDGYEHTCYESSTSQNNTFQISLVQNYLIESVQIVIPKDKLELYEKLFRIVAIAWVVVSKPGSYSQLCGSPLKYPESFLNFTCDPPLEGENVSIHVQSKEPHVLLLCEVKVKGIPISEVTNTNSTSNDTSNKEVEVKGTTMSEVAKSNSTINDRNDKSPVQIGPEKLFSSVFTPRSFDDKIFTICIHILVILVEILLLFTIIKGIYTIYKVMAGQQLVLFNKH